MGLSGTGPQSQNQALPTSPQPRSEAAWHLVQALLGAGAGFAADYLVLRLSLDVLIRLKIITLLDAFDSIYSNRGLQDEVAWGMFAFLALGFFCVARVRRWHYFGIAALVMHLLFGGLWTLAFVFIRW